MNKPLAPLIIGAYRRVSEFRRCIYSLSLCRFACQTDLYVTLDYPINAEVRRSQCEILNIIDLVRNCFLSVNIITNQCNSDGWIIEDTKRDLINKYGCFIFLEDDILVHQDFLVFMNHSLTIMDQDLSILSVSGYSFIDYGPPDHVSFIKWRGGSNGWGMAMTRRTFEMLPSSNAEGVARIKDYILNVRNYISESLETDTTVRTKLVAVLKKQYFGDAYFGALQRKENMYTLFPSRPLVANIGFSGLGKNCKINSSKNFIFSKDRRPEKLSIVFDKNSVAILSEEISFLFKRNLIYKIFNLGLFLWLRVCFCSKCF